MILFNLLFGIIPIGLVIAAGELIRKRGNPDTASRRYFLFLVWASIGLTAIIMTLQWFTLPLGGGFATLLAPVVTAVIALALLHLSEWKKLHDREKTAIGYTLLVLSILLLVQFVLGKLRGGEWSLETILLGSAIVITSLLLAIFWWVGNRHPVLVGMLALFYMLAFNVFEGGALPFFDETPNVWLSIGSVTVYLILPSLVISSIALLISTVINPPAMFDEPRMISWRTITVRLLFAIILLGSLVYTTAWLCIWDGTDDGIRGIIILMLSILAAVAGGMVITMTSIGWRRWVGAVFAILVIGLIRWAIAVPGNMYRPYDITEARAARIQKAIENHHTKTSWYPFKLSDLVPGEMWRIPLPMIMPDEDWCYQGGSNYYRLGTIYREHWSSPYLSIKIYATAGTIPEEPWVCDEKLADLMSRSSSDMDPVPNSTPLPASEVSVERTIVEPVFSAASLTVGDWSPEGDYLVFGETSLTGETNGPVKIDLQFINGQTGEVCTAAKNDWKAEERSDGLYQHYAWLPNGRFLYVSEAGEMAVFSPCVDGVEDLASRYPVRFTQVVSFDRASGRAVLRSQDSYWLLDGTTLKAQPIPDVLPTTLVNQRDLISWSIDGDRFAISQLNGQDAGAGANIFIVNGVSGKIEMSIPLIGTSELLDTPFIDWLTDGELLANLPDSLIIIDIRSDPPKTTDLIRDVFLLDLSYPIEFSSMDFVRNPAGDGYSIGVRVNHPHNQNAYLYDSVTGQVKIFEHDVSTLLFFPDEKWMQLPKWEDTPSYKDEYEMVWMDQSEKVRRLVVEGHVPRNHPQIFPKYLPDSSQLVFNSSQGISLISIPDGETIRFWELAGGGGYSTRVLPSPREDALVILADGDGLYHIPLPTR